MTDATCVDVVCPAGVGEGDLISVEHAGEAFDVAVPPGVSEGDAFTVELPEAPRMSAVAPPGKLFDSDDGYGGLGAVAKELEEAHKIAAEFTGASLDMRDAKPGAAEVLAAALRQLVNAVEDAVEDLDAFIEEHCAKFASWQGMSGEQVCGAWPGQPCLPRRVAILCDLLGHPASSLRRSSSGRRCTRRTWRWSRAPSPARSMSSAARRTTSSPSHR